MMRAVVSSVIGGVLGLAYACAPALAESPPFELRDGDRVVLLGDGLIEREQQSGYVKTMLTSAWPGQNITFRNLGYTGDTPRGESRVGFGSDDNTHGWRPPAKRDPKFGVTTLMRQVVEARPTVIFVGYGSAAAFDDAVVEWLPSRDDGTMVSGIAGPKAGGVLPLRDAEGTLLSIPVNSTEETTPGAVSLMPSGLVRSLKRHELLDLLKFLTALARDPQFAVAARPVVRHWEVLRSGGVKASAPSADVDLAALEKTGEWEPRYSTAAGALPISELPEIPSERRCIVRFRVEAAQPGTAEVRCTQPAGVQLLENGRFRSLATSSTIALTAGRQLFVLVIDRRKSNAALQLELHVNEPGVTAARLGP
jgi:hypothetical protein